MSKNKQPTITAQVMVKNEDQWIWYALKSVLDFVDRLLIYDTGSKDKTVSIIKTINSPKIVFEEKQASRPAELTALRQKQLERTETDWLLVLDGDEVWPRKALIEAREMIVNSSLDIWGIVVPAWNLINDLYHFHPESQDFQWPYAPRERKGWMNLRFIRRDIPGLHLEGDYPDEAYCLKGGKALQELGEKRLGFLENRYFHLTYLKRSSLRGESSWGLKRGPRKIPEIGRRLPKLVSFPEVFYLPKPEIVPSCWRKPPLRDKIKAVILTPLKWLKRLIFGYRSLSRRG